MIDETSYWVNFTVKNGEDMISESIEKLFAQSIKPSLICIVDDGSTDSTPKIISEFKQKHSDEIHIITLPDKGYDIRRIVHNLNAACDYVKKSGIEYDYMLISNEDVFFPENYVETLIEHMKNDTKLAVASGSRGIEPSDELTIPEGAGRFVRTSYFKKIGFRFPPYYGYEAWLLYKALQLGYKIKKLADLKYEHSRTFGSEHNFIEYGPTMRCLGYHPLFVLARILRNLLTSKTGISKKASIKMFFEYFDKRKWKNDPYYNYFEPEFREFVSTFQKKRLLSKFKI